VRRVSRLLSSSVGAAISCCVLVVGAGTATAAIAASSVSPASANATWGSAQKVPGLASLNTSGGAVIDSVSCSSAGNCSAGGGYADAAGGQGFVVSEVGGVWGSAEPVPGLAALNVDGDAEVLSVSCTTAGNCSAGGYYGISTDGTGFVHTQAFVVSQVDGTWDMAQEVPGTAELNSDTYAHVSSVSCTSPGDCSAGGFYTAGNDYNSAFVVDESSGTWGTALTVPGTPAASTSGNSFLNSVSCTSPGYCAASGGSLGLAIVVDEADGTWGTAQQVPGIASLSTGVAGSQSMSVSCASAGSCSAGGFYDPGPFGSEAVDSQAFVVTETDGTWGTVQEVPGTASLNSAKDALVSSVSCASAGNCSLGGYYASTGRGSAYEHAFVADEANGVWGTAQEVPGTSTLNVRHLAQVSSISCSSAGNCGVGGFYTDADSRQQAFVADETAGVWGQAEEVPGTGALNAGGFDQVNSVSCASDGSCGAGGSYTTVAITTQAFVVDKSVTEPTSTTLTLSASGVIYGDEQGEMISVTVSAGSAGTPGGTVTIRSGTASVCVITLASGTGNCSLTARKLGAGTRQLVATYGGGIGFGGSASATEALTVAKAASTTSMALSAAKVSYGHEKKEHLTVTVSPQYGGTPAGTVTVKAGNITVCTITLVSGKGNCTLSAKKLSKGTRHLAATYDGNTDFTSSTSATRTLKVVK
jgi:hypothetical protein